jgi:glucokinase
VLVAAIVGFVAVGVPLVALAWHNLNHLLSGDVDQIRLATVLGAGAGLAVVLYGLAKVVNRLTGTGNGSSHA